MKPNYRKSLVNLIASIAKSFDIQSTYSPLESKSLDDMEEASNVILLIIDGVGHNYLKTYAPTSLLHRNLKDSMTSVFLPSTGSAITSIMTGLAPQQHGVTGWFVHLREYGVVSRILPYSNTIDYNLIGSEISNVISSNSVFESLGKNYSLILPDQISDSVFTKNLAKNANRSRYSDLGQFFEQIKKAVSNSTSRSYIYGYWPRFDASAHVLGSRSEESQRELKEFDNHLRSLVESLEGTNTKLIVTSDHGFNDVDKSHVIYTHDHPDFEDCLVLPLCGDTRTVYAYVRPSKITQFERYVQTRFGHACELHSSDDLIEDNWFGLYDRHPRLYDRVGDFTLIFREGHAIINCFPGFEPLIMKGHHGGISSNEMLLPLCVFDC
ncbi:hypothetical protein EU527_14525 [Candidatus Thorarchaeota archaeon]|nr:MAG: hypothetical protein EU527_14525 [Candidatus Thorarchaeota archaeon]